MSHDEIAEILTREEGRPVSRQYVSALERSGIAKLRKIMAKRQLKAADLLPD